MDKAVLPFRVDTSSGMPIYLQLIDQVRHFIARGLLRPGDEMPSVRALATAQRINPNTVAHAYRQLESDGIICKRRGMGTYVSEHGSGGDRGTRLAAVRQQLDRAVSEGLHLGLEPGELRSMLDQILAQAQATR